MTKGRGRTSHPAGAAVCPAWSRRPEAIRLFARGVTLRPCVPVAVVVGIVLSAANEGLCSPPAILPGRTGSVWPSTS
jgi:hypothetical protein